MINAPLVREGKPYPPRSLAEFELLPGVPDACALLRHAGYNLVVATNQPDVGRGELEASTVEAIHQKMCELLPIDRVEVCYDPGRGEHSEFRKPRPGMLLRAAGALGIDLRQSYMVGDRWRDIDCGHAAGCQTIFVDWNYDEPLRAQPHFTVPDLLSAAYVILSR